MPETVAEVEPPATAEPAAPASAPAVPAAAPAAPAAAPAPAPAAPSPAAEKPVKPKTEARLYGSRTLGQWIKRVVLLVVGAVAAAAILVLAARGVTTLPGVPEFLERYPGEYHLPEAAEPGFPWWAQWTHFLNFFLMVLIIRSGYQVRTQQKPPAFWTPKRGGKKISINLWLHQSLDILWLANGLIFVVLLFASGHWMRIVPTSWFAGLPRPVPRRVPPARGRDVGFPAWVQWQHFFNVFLMVLIIRSGLQVRTEKQPRAFWTPKWSKDGKARSAWRSGSTSRWTSCGCSTGVIFVVMLFVTGHWMRIVPTSWEVFPNALSALLQYMSLDWPTENGWVNYNSLQQLMYFLTVFIAAPLAAITGVRMSRALAEEREDAEQDLPGRVGARDPLPGDAVLRAVHHHPRRSWCSRPGRCAT